MKKFLYILLVFTVLSSCNEYQKALKAEDVATKFKMGETLYNEGKFSKANRLFAQIVPNYRGKPQAEKLMYMYSKSFYEMKDYYLASYQFDRFVSAYPNSEKLEEAAFISAKSAYELSPIYSKDQTETIEAIDKLQGFINLYPNSEYTAEANKLFRELDFKLEKKAYEIAKQYNHLSDFQASIQAFDKFIFDFPGSTLREDALFYRLDSAYKLGINSVEIKKRERLETAQVYASSFKTSYKDSEHIEAVNKMLTDVKEQLQNYTTQS